MEQKLADYRARKAKLLQDGGRAPGPPGDSGQEKGKSLTRIITEGIHNIRSKWRSPDIPQNKTPDLRMETTAQTAATTEESASLDTPSSGGSMWKLSLLLKVLLWLVLLGLFVELEFGLAYFVLSMFYWIYEGTRKPGQKKRGEKSAYSVFNPGCESIQGTLTAEQFERELQYRPLAGM